MNSKKTIPEHQLKRLVNISHMLREMRFADGRTQNGYKEMGLSRRQIQHGESGCNISLLKLFTILDAYGYHLSDLDNID